MAALTDDEQSELKYWLGYGGLTQYAIPYLPHVGSVLLFDAVIVLSLSDWANDKIRDIFVSLRAIETQVQSQLRRRKADELVGEIRLNKDELHDVLEAMDYYVRQLENLCQIERRRVSGGNHLTLG